MPKTRQDFEPILPSWLVSDWIPLGHRVMDVGPEGSFKTMWGAYLSVCIASGYNRIFQHDTLSGPVLIVDEETPESSLNNHLDRFSRGMGLKYSKLPIYPYCMTGFRFGRKTELNKLLSYIKAIKPIFIRMDSMLAMLPSGRQSISENDCHLGETIRDDLIAILKENPECSIMLSTHTKKFVSDISFQDISKYDMQFLVRGHGSIVGEGCDTGLIIKKISEHPNPTRFCITTKPRRQAIPTSSRVVYVELEEEEYGEGWARLKEISPDSLPPSDLARSIYPLFKGSLASGKVPELSLEKIYRKTAILSKKECRAGMSELFSKKVIVISMEPLTYELNPFVDIEVNNDYLRVLNNSNPII